MNRNKMVAASGLLVLIISVIISACGKEGVSATSDFDRKAMLQNYADNLIKPAFSDLQLKVNTLKTATDAFTFAPNVAKLTTMQTAWDEAYSSWMYANSFNFGPAGDEGIRKGLVEEIGTWPVNTTTVESNIVTNNTAFSEFNRDNRGLNAIEYLIYSDGNNSNTVIAFNNSANKKNYLSALVSKLKLQVDGVATEWNTTYAATFVSRNGTDVGSSTSQMYNEFVRSFESIKNFKVGLPLGKRIGQTATEPGKVEARYSKQSLKYIRLHLKSLEDCWYGRSKTGTDGIGWREYLDFVTGGKDLIIKTETQMAAYNAALNAISLSASLEQEVSSNNAVLTLLHTELQKQIRFYKSDMSSLLGIAITFSSGDGD